MAKPKSQPPIISEKEELVDPVIKDDPQPSIARNCIENQDGEDDPRNTTQSQYPKIKDYIHSTSIKSQVASEGTEISLGNETTDNRYSEE